MHELISGPDAAQFSERGELLELHSRDRRWRPADPAPGWSLTVLREDERVRLRPGPGVSLNIGGEDALQMRWDHVLDPLGDEVPVNVTLDWTLSNGDLSARLSVTDLPSRYVLDAVVLPDLVFPCESPADTSLIVPREVGWQANAAAEGLLESEAAFTYPGDVHMQCFGWREGPRGLCTECRDEEGWIKRWCFSSPEPGQVRMRIEHLVPRQMEPPGSFTLPYPVVLGGFDGSWFDLARLYRRWAMRTRWASRGPDRRRDGYFGLPACWVWNRGRIEDVVPPVKELARRIGAPVALDWYWWHKHPYDTEYPDYFPPREGEGAFRSAVEDLQANDVFVQVYTNGMCYDVDGAAWEPDGPRCAIVQEDGTWHAPAYNVFMNHRLASTCGASERWREIVVDIAGNARELGLDGLYLDMIAAVGGGRPCYNPHHPHPPGGGCYGVRGFRETLRQARETAPELALSSEATLECYMDLLEGYITPGVSLERLKWQAEQLGGRTEVVPLFSAVYHGRCVCFGNYGLFDNVPPFDELWPREYRRPPEQERDWRALCPDQFALELARTVVFGHQPLVGNLRTAHLTDEAYEEDVAFLVSICRLYHAHRELLLWGTMLPPGRLECAEKDVRFLQRFLFTKPGEETFLVRPRPRVLHSAWRAPDGTAALLLINWSRREARARHSPTGWSGRVPARTGLLVGLPEHSSAGEFC